MIDRDQREWLLIQLIVANDSAMMNESADPLDCLVQKYKWLIKVFREA